MWCPRYACRPRPHAAPAAAVLSVTAYRRSPVAATPASAPGNAQAGGHPLWASITPPRCPLPCPVDTAAPCLRPPAPCHPERSEGSIFTAFCLSLKRKRQRERRNHARQALPRSSFPVQTGNPCLWPFVFRPPPLALHGKRQKAKNNEDGSFALLRMTRGGGCRQANVVSAICCPPAPPRRPCRALWTPPPLAVRPRPLVILNAVKDPSLLPFCLSFFAVYRLSFARPPLALHGKKQKAKNKKQ